MSVVRSVLLELTTAGGLTGWGKASPWPAFSGTVEIAVAALHVHLRPILVGADPLRLDQIMARADAVVAGCPEAKAALETALLDIAGKMAGLPIAELVGGRCRDGRSRWDSLSPIRIAHGDIMLKSSRLRPTPPP